MTYLELCQKLALKVGAGSITTVVGQTGNAGRLVMWIDEAYNEIQTMHQDWDWMRASASFTTVAGQAIYPLGTGAGTVGVLAANFGMWDPYTFRNFPTATGNSTEIFMDAIDYDAWRDAYQFGSLRSVQTRPMQFAVGPAKQICVGPPSDGLYTVTGDYFTAPVSLTADADVPALPAQYQWVIIYKAMMLYGAYEAASEVYEEGKYNFSRMTRRLEADRLPMVMFSGPLA